MRKGLIFILVISISFLMGCNKTAETSKTDINEEIQTTITVVVPKSPVAIPILRMIETNALGEKGKIDVQFYTDMDKMMALATSKEYAYLAVPINAAATLYNKGFDIKLLNVILWEGMNLSTTDSNCNKWEDLTGEQLYIPSKGSITDIITQYFLNQHGLKIGENIEVVYSSHADIAQLIKSNKAKYAIDVEPFVTSNKANIENYRVVSSFADEWKKSEGNEYSMPVFGVTANNEYLTKNKELVKSFNDELEKSIKWSLDNPSEAGVLAEKYLNANSKFIENAFPNFQFIYKSSLEARKDIEKYCDVVLSSLKPESVGGKIPDENFYYKDE